MPHKFLTGNHQQWLILESDTHLYFPAAALDRGVWLAESYSVFSADARSVGFNACFQSILILRCEGLAIVEKMTYSYMMERRCNDSLQRKTLPEFSREDAELSLCHVNRQ